MERATSIVERAIRWMSPVLLVGICANVPHQHAHDELWALCVQIPLVFAFFATAFAGRHLPPTLRMCIYCGSCVAYGMVELIRWGLVGQGLPISILAVALAAGFAMLRWEQMFRELLRTNRLLNENEARLRMVLSGAELGAWDWNVRTGTVTFDARWATMLGYGIEEIEPHVRFWERSIHPDDHAHVMDAVRAHLAGETPTYETEHRVRHKSGDWVWVLDKGTVIERDADGAPLRMCGTHLDITSRRQAMDALRTSAQNYREIFNATSDAIFVHDSSGTILDVNERMCELLGYSHEEALGATLGDVSQGRAPYSLDKARDWVRKAYEEGPQRFDWRAKRKDGECLWVEVALRATRIGGEERVIAAVHDISDRIRAEEALRERQETINAIVETSQDWIWASDAQGVLTYSNPAVEKILGYLPEEIIGQGSTLIHEEDRTLVNARWPEWTRERRGWVNMLLRWRCKNGDHRYLESSAVPILTSGGELVGYRGVNRDVTERKRHEEDLRRRTEEIERFTYAVSHDLRAPLVTITAFLAYLRKHIEAGDAERVRRDVEHILNATDKMGRLLNELLEFSRIGGQVNPPEDVILQDLVDDALQLVAGRITQRGVEVAIRIATPYVVCGDRRRLLAVFQNLIDNAVKFMGDEAAPLVEIGVEERQETAIVFVRDNGMGIDSRHIHKLFGMFEKLHPEIEGAGVGLAMTKRIVEKHGGKIWIEPNATSKGVTFCFTLADLKPGSVVKRAQKLCRAELA